MDPLALEIVMLEEKCSYHVGLLSE